MNEINRLAVYYDNRQVGTMAWYNNASAVFEYTTEWLVDGFSISPISLPLEKKVFIPKSNNFYGLFGVFADSLPDGWGRLLVDRLMLRNKLNPHTVGPMQRLAIVGESGMGALVYRPEINIRESTNDLSLDEIAAECAKVLKAEYSNELDKLFVLGGSSGGTRPKILTKVDGEDWIIKFPSTHDSPIIGKQEYDYALCAKNCGIRMEEVRLLPSETTEGYFGTRRFDRNCQGSADNKIHMISSAALLETSHRIPNLDYNLLMRLTLQLTSSMSECEHLFRLMCFNVFAHNRDDHAKNFSYIYHEDASSWQLSPAYDLTHSNSIGGEHATTINGNGKNPSKTEIMEVAKTIGINTRRANSIVDQVQECVYSHLREYIN
ncbi:MAG: type II toxin-antitoxin system HipA family toxin [Clostridiaceae bacterium]|nr:type II toxin-antitoxin system HipA family toxin [Clostridiaceae bacterium]